MWSWHWSPLTQTSLLLSPCDGLASFLKTTLANGIKVVKKVITRKFRFHLIAIYALGCFHNFSCTPVPTKITLKSPPPNPVRLVKELILMLLIKKTINLKTVYILISDVFFFIKKNVTTCLGHHYAIWTSDSNFLLAQKFFFRYWSWMSIEGKGVCNRIGSHSVMVRAQDRSNQRL
jgi:hypothetical protein